MIKFWLPLLFILGLSVAYAATDIVGPFGTQNSMGGFTGRWPPLVGRVGSGGGGGGGGCAGVIDASAGCPLPMLGM